MKSQATTFVAALLENLLHDCSHKVSSSNLRRDIETINSRLREEGIAFATKTLPRFFKAVLAGVETGTYIPPDGFTRRRGSLLPAFLRGWTTRIFTHDGKVRSDLDEYSFQELYQICAACYKMELPYPKRVEKATIDTFKSNETTVKAFVLPDDCLSRSVRSLARQILHTVLRDVCWRDIKPKHGPGATATAGWRGKGNGKYHWSTKYQRLHSQYPYYEYFCPSLSAVCHTGGSDWYKRLEPSVTPRAKVCLVPKDSRGPRLISMEPVEIQWIQQGMHRLIVDAVERHPITRGRVNFTDSSFNREAALKASVNGDFATIDLKDASDMIPLSLVRDLFPAEFLDKAEACRSTATLLPGGSLALAKFAPMGSALCFPVMALTLFALTLATLRLWRYDDTVLVYGDDLIVRSDAYGAVRRTLESHCLKINSMKSFYRGKFRESCGLDAYNGVVVTPIRLRHAPGATSPSTSVYTHLIELSDAFFDKGYWKTCAFLRRKLRRLYGKIPWSHTRSGPGYYCPDLSVSEERNSTLFKKRTNQALQRTEFLIPVVRPIKRLSGAGWRVRLLKGLLGLYSEQDEDWMVAERGLSRLRPRWCMG